MPNELPRGVYVAQNQPGTYPGCEYTTMTDDGKVIDTVEGLFQDSVTAELLSAPIAKFETSGCTPWVKMG